MKRTAIWALAGLLLHCQGLWAQKRESRETIRQEIGLEGGVPSLEVKNINGSVSVEGYAGTTVWLEIEKIIRADNEQKLELGKQEIGIETLHGNTGTVIRLKGPCFTWDDHRDRPEDCNRDKGYDFTLNFKLRVPQKINLEVSTVNDGEVAIRHMRGAELNAANVNGGIALEDITGQTNVNCVNGDVEISYAENPSGESTYYALNGDINIKYRGDLSAEIDFKSLNGDIFTDFELSGQYSRTTTEPADRKKGRLKYEAQPVIKIGAGAVPYHFETLNGDVYIKKS